MATSEISVRSKPKSVTLDDERVLPDSADRATFLAHMARYEHVLPMIAPSDRVLETACGAGYGTHRISQRARSVVAIDYSPLALSYARERFAAPNLHYLQMDCHRLAFASAAFDLVVSFEVFEHLERPQEYAAECARVLRPGGRLVLSTPNRAAWELHMSSIGQEYEFHSSMVDLDELRASLRPCFSKVEVFGQRRRGSRLYSILRSLDPWNLRLRLFPPKARERLQKQMGVATGEQLQTGAWVFSKSQIRQCNHFVAVCTR